MKTLILAGGQGMRLRPFTLSTPKPLLPLANIPFLDFPLALLRKHGSRDAVLCTSDHLKPYNPFIKRQKGLGTRISCSNEPTELGTAGALRNAERHIDSPAFFVFNGDILSDLDLSAMLKFHRKMKSLITVGLIRIEDPTPYGLVETDSRGRVLEFIEKPSPNSLSDRNDFWINGGIYVFDKSVLGHIPKGRKYSAERDLFPEFVRREMPIYGFHAGVSTYWLDFGSPEKYLKANMDVLNGHLSKVLPRGRRPAIGKGSIVHKKSFLSKDTVIGNRCRIGAGSVLKNCVLLDRVTVGEEAVLERCIIGGGSKIGAHVRLTDALKVGNRSRISSYSRL